MLALTAPLSLQQAGGLWWDGVIYGPPGCGKTAFATTSRLKTFIFDVDRGLNSAIPFRIRKGLPLTNDWITVWPVQSIADFDAAYMWLQNNINAFYGGLVVVDSFTELQRIIIRDVSKKTGHITPDQRDWGVVRTLSEKMMVDFRYMPFHFLMTCHEISKQDPDFNREVWRPSFDGRVAFEYAKHFSWIGRYQLAHVPGPVGQDGRPTQQLIRFINCGPSPYQHYKDRSGMLTPYEYPDYDTLLAKMQQSTDPTTWQNMMVQQERQTTSNG